MGSLASPCVYLYKYGQPVCMDCHCLSLFVLECLCVRASLCTGMQCATPSGDLLCFFHFSIAEGILELISQVTVRISCFWVCIGNSTHLQLTISWSGFVCITSMFLYLLCISNLLATSKEIVTVQLTII
jgi:hypothetical protein